jgi:HAE1 family hydrophobic/amphiphilic exporter-1
MRAKGANVVEVCDEVKRRLPDLQRRLRAMSPDLQIGISTDYSLFIKEDIDEVKFSLLLGIALTAMVAFLFLGSLGTTFNVCLAIPTSLVGTFMAMKWFNFTINFMTLLAMSLSVGVVVDDAILVLENIYRRREEGEGRYEAAWFGAREITFAALAATFSIAAIFIPVAFMKGAIGAFFYQFGITCTVSVLLSLIIALTITPMLCSVFLNVRRMARPCPKRWGGLFGPPITLFVRAYWVLDRWVLELLFVRPMNALMHASSRLYSRALRFCLRHPWPVLAGSLLLAAVPLVLIFGLTVPLPDWLAGKVGKPAWVIKPIGRELVPSEDQNRFVVNVICPVGTGIDYINSMLGKGEQVLAELKDPVNGNELIASMFAAVSIRPGSLISEGILFVRLIPATDRTVTQNEIIALVRKQMLTVAGMRAIVMDLSTQGFTATRGYPVNFAVQGPDWNVVTQFAETIRERMIDARSEATDTPILTDVNTDYRPGMPEIHVRPDRDKCAALGVSIERVAYTINVAFGGVRQGRFTELDKRYDVRLRLLEQQRQSPHQLMDLCVKSRAGKLVSLADLTEVSEHSTLPQLYRYNHLRKVELTANMGPGISQGEGIARAWAIANEVREEMSLPESYRIVPLGNAQAMAETLHSMWGALALGFVVAYMILGVQFNSFVHPFTVLMAVPFGVTGALLMLWWAGDTLNLMSMIGLVLLAGLVKKNSIILVDYTNQLREQGLPLEEAVQTACPVRLRPIIMTSLATIASAIPLAMGYGPGAETRAPLARSIIGGIFLSTLVTLILVPVFYVELEKLGQWVRRLSRRGPREDESPQKPTPVPAPREEAPLQGAAPRPELEPVLEVRPETS